MRTIDNYLSYHLSWEEVEAFLELWIINGCWGEWGFSFDNFIEDNIKYLSYFDDNKVTELRNDLTRICYEHDLEFFLQLGFFKSNWRMTKKVYWILYWVTPFKKFAICSVLLILLMRHWKDFYNQCERWTTPQG